MSAYTTAATVLVTLGAASCFGYSAALQYQGVREVARHTPLDPRLFGQLIRRPRWVAAWIPDAAGTSLQAWALALGALALVEPVLVSGLFLAVLLEAVLSRRTPGRRDLFAVSLSAVGLAVFLVFANPRGGVAEPTPIAWAAAALVAVAVVAGCLLMARPARPALRGVLLGIATGVLYGLVASLLKVSTARLELGLRALLTDWPVYALAVVGISGYLLNQNAFQSGPLAAPMTALTLTDPVFSVVIAVTAFHEQLSVSGFRLPVEIAAVALMARGVWLTSRLLEPGPGPGPRSPT
jgi:drug/metabolite transporter (DMT)-like permease